MGPIVYANKPERNTYALTFNIQRFIHEITPDVLHKFLEVVWKQSSG